MNRSYRLKANVGSDQVLNVDLKQDIDIYEVLSLELSQEKLYKMHSANYGVIVGRVLANDAFGVPNAKVSVFIPLTKEDRERRGIRDIYPYNFVTDVDRRNVKYNTLPNYKRFECHQPVGSFPNKRLLLDEDSILELYDKYYKYTTITNKAGDYMIFGVPVGEQIIHVDVDLSDIGILSQEPRDFIYKGYSINLFESPTQFKKGTNLDNLPQIQNQSTSVNVYPLWGDKNSNEIAITRKDITLQYKFEPTCVFLGSIITDNGMNSISHNCIPDEKVGEAEQLVASKGDIEMIRKTLDDKVEEYPIKGNQLIDGDGTWCYQIPMNLDYIGMDEYGNVIPTNNPNKGIPTRTRVRFRVTLDESGNDTLTTHKARYLIPNNPELYEGMIKPCVHEDVIDKDSYYQFGTLTPENCFRDLYWNKVYSVKNYIPRVQMSAYENTTNYLSIKGVNKKGAYDKNLIPYNKLNANLTLPAYLLTQYANYDDTPGWYELLWRMFRVYSRKINNDEVLEKAVEDMDGISLDFYNDWLNGCLYFPAWFWHVRQKKNYKNGESVYESSFCECKKELNIDMPSELYIYNNGSIFYNNADLEINDTANLYDQKELFNRYTNIPYGSKRIRGGIIKKMTNKDGADAFYYSFGNAVVSPEEKIKSNDEFDNQIPSEIRPQSGKHYYYYARLYSTDIILLGSLKDCDLDGVPKMQYNLPSTTAIIPPIGKYKDPVFEDVNGEESEAESDDPKNETNFVTYNGMNWGKAWYDTDDFSTLIAKLAVGANRRKEYKYNLGSGLFFGISIPNRNLRYAKKGYVNIFTDIKTPVNLERICELGVTLDSEAILKFIRDEKYGVDINYYNEIDGLITRREIEDVNSRALFATLNYNKLIGTVENYNTGYKKYNLVNLYPSNFDGRLERIATAYTVNKNDETIPPITNDIRNRDYLDFKFGNNAVGTTSEATNIIPYPIKAYRSLIRWFNGKKMPFMITITSIKDNDSRTTGYTTNGGEYTSYTIGDGIAKFNRFTKPKLRHFYGYDLDYDTVEPFCNNAPQETRFCFPLYDNSFYFYFGLKQGSTAIDKFYEQFYAECKEENTDPFIVKIDVEASNACQPAGGKIFIDVEEIEKPYTVTVKYKSNGKVLVENSHSPSVINYVPNGRYTVVITDAYGTYMEQDVILAYKKIELNTTLTRRIMTEYFGDYQKETICGNNLYGKLAIESFNLYGEEYRVTGITDGNGDYDYKLSGLNVNNSNDTKKVGLTITPSDGSAFTGYTCSPEFEVVGGVYGVYEFHIWKPDSFIAIVSELCGSDEHTCENSTQYTINVYDTKNLEMYINNVPLKYVVGRDEKLEEYNPWFHYKGDAVTGITSDTIKGWFGVHNPAIYSDIFTANMAETDPNYKVNSKIWTRDIGSSDIIDIIEAKLKYMFRLSNGTYVTAGNKNTFSVRLGGATGNLLLRSAMPVYDEFEINPPEETEPYKVAYVTGERSVATCNEIFPNIISENYNCTPPIGTYSFNCVYETNQIKNAGNYFAGFSNNANIIQTGDDSCREGENTDYQVIPFKVDNLFNFSEQETMCLTSEKNGISDKVSDAHDDTYKKYFRTEFIDRRFDYDAVIVTGHKCNHYDANGEYEKEATWNKARISALTYNGIEMLYNETDNGKLIVSDAGDTEYNYNTGTSIVTLNVDHNKPKRFYESTLYYGNNNAIDMTNAFYYQGNRGATATTAVSENDEDIEIVTGHTIDGDDKFKFFGFYDENAGETPSVHGYASKRWLDYYNVPYSDRYTFTNVSCSYDGIDVEKNNNSIIAYAKPGETVSFTVDSNEIVNIVPVEFNQNKYNILFTGATSGTLTATNIKELYIRVTPEYIGDEFETTTTSIKVCQDNTLHNRLKEIKTATTASINGEEIIGTYSHSIDTDDNFKNHIFSATNITLDSTTKSLFIAVDRKFLKKENDLLKRGLRVINTSTIYEINNFSFSYGGASQKDYNSQQVGNANVVGSRNYVNVNGGTYDVNDGEGSVTIPNQNPSVQGDDGHVSDVQTSMKKDYLTFTFTNAKFLVKCLNDMRINVDFEGIESNYSIGNGITIESSVDAIAIGVLLSQQNKSLFDPNVGTAKVKMYLKINNGIKSVEGDGYMVFAFGFTINKIRITSDLTNL